MSFYVTTFQGTVSELEVKTNDSPYIEDHNEQEGTPLDVKELCRRLEAFRVERRMSTLKEKSKALQSDHGGYKRRVSDNSRRTSRMIDTNQEETQDIHAASSLWINPKRMIAVRAAGLTEVQATLYLNEERSKEKDGWEASKKQMNRLSMAALTNANERPALVDRGISLGRLRPISVAIRTTSSTTITSNPAIIENEIVDKRKSWVPITGHKTNWAQEDDNDKLSPTDSVTSRPSKVADKMDSKLVSVEEDAERRISASADSAVSLPDPQRSLEKPSSISEQKIEEEKPQHNLLVVNDLPAPPPPVVQKASKVTAVEKRHTKPLMESRFRRFLNKLKRRRQ